jgi:hypothetical protein
MEPFPDFPEPQLPQPARTNFMPLMIAAGAFSLVVLILSLNMEEEPVFEKIDEISIHYLSNTGGLTQKTLTRIQTTRIIDCLLGNTRRLDKGNLETEILPSTYLIEIRNGDGRNSLELISRNNLADTQGYYHNDCIYGLIQ